MILELKSEPHYSIKKHFFLFFLLLTFGNLHAQQGVLAINQADGKAVFLGQGASVRFTYLGYKNQVQETKGIILNVNDTALQLRTGSLFKKDTFTLNIHDIYGFRYYPISRQLGKLALDIGLLGSNLIVYTNVLTPAPISPIARVAISASVGAASWAVKKLIFPDKVKKTKANGWEFKPYSPK